jgi:hypothetical protein
MLDIILIICSVVIVVAWLVSNDWECLMCHWRNHALFFIIQKHNIVVFSFDALFGLTWCMLTPCYDYKPSRLKHLWPFSFWLVISLYALINNVLLLCMIMAIIALLVGRSQSFACLHLYWVWALLVHPTPQNQSLPMCPPYLPISILLFQVYSSCFYLSSKLKNVLCFLALNKLDYCDSLMSLICLQVVSWKLARPCFHGARFQHCTYFYLVDIMIFCLWMPSGVK